MLSGDDSMFFRFSILEVGHRNFRIESGKEAAIELFMTPPHDPQKRLFINVKKYN